MPCINGKGPSTATRRPWEMLRLQHQNKPASPARRPPQGLILSAARSGAGLSSLSTPSVAATGD